MTDMTAHEIAEAIRSAPLTFDSLVPLSTYAGAQERAGVESALTHAVIATGTELVQLTGRVTAAITEESTARERALKLATTQGALVSLPRPTEQANHSSTALLGAHAVLRDVFDRLLTAFAKVSGRIVATEEERAAAQRRAREAEQAAIEQRQASLTSAWNKLGRDAVAAAVRRAGGTPYKTKPDNVAYLVTRDIAPESVPDMVSSPPH